jgi:hypothetical protein
VRSFLSPHQAYRTTVNHWLRHCPTWQFVAVPATATVCGVMLGEVLAQWLWRHHFDLSVPLGSAVGCALGSTIIAVWHRQYQRWSVRPPRR